MGTQLRDKIADVLTIDGQEDPFRSLDVEFQQSLSDLFYEVPRNHDHFRRSVSHVARNIRLAASVDSYLDSHMNDPLRVALAKLAIAHFISVYENRSGLRCSNINQAENFDFRLLSNTWLQRLWSIMQVNAKRASVVDMLNSVKFITFNYDRCIEQFFFLALVNFFDIDPPSARRMVAALGVLHVYGSLGPLDTLPGSSGDFSHNYPRHELQQKRLGIKTFTEQIDSEVVTRMTDYFSWAQQIIFVGYSFSPVNNTLIEKATEGLTPARSVIATSHGLSEEHTYNTNVWLDLTFGGGNSVSKVRPNKAVEIFERFANEL